MKATIWSPEFRAICQVGDFNTIVNHANTYNRESMQSNHAYLNELVSKLLADIEVLKVQHRAMEDRLRQQYATIADEHATEILDASSRNIDKIYRTRPEMGHEQACGITLNHILQQVWVMP